MPTTVWRIAATGANYNPGSGAAWGTPSAITVSDDTRATASIAAGGNSQVLRASNFGFTTADIPSGATITGIEIRVERGTGNIGPQDLIASLAMISAGTAADRVGANKANLGVNWGAFVETQAIFGAPSDMWSSGLTDANIRSASFAFDFVVTNSAGVTRNASVDSIEARITYADPSQIAGSTALAFTSSAVLVGTGALSGSAALTLALEGVISEEGQIYGSAGLSLAGSGTLVGTGDLHGFAALSLEAAAGDIQAVGSLAGTATVSFGPAGTLNAVALISGTASFSLGTSASLTFRGVMTVFGSVTASRSARGFSRPYLGSRL
jgi:hypothetical protein